MSCYNILFDFDTNLESLCYKSLVYKDNSNNDFKLDERCYAKPIGSFLLDFLNTDFENENSFNNFLIYYCFEEFYLKYKNEISSISLIKKEQLADLLKSLYKKYSKGFIENRNFLIDIIDKDDSKINLSSLSEDELNLINIDDEEELYKKYTLFDYGEEIHFFDSEINDLRLDFIMHEFFPYNVDGTLTMNIPYSFKSNDYFNIIYISFRQLLYSNKKLPIRKCCNCHKYFIPKTMHDTKYCDEIYKNNKTCKEIGRELAYKESLLKEPLLKAYRSRYQTLSKQASEKDYHEMYEYFKKEGPFMRTKFKNNEITAEEFQAWIDSTKFRRK